MHIGIGSRLELFVDHYLIDRLDGARLKLHPPTRREIAIQVEYPWEGNSCGYVTVMKDHDLFRMYYRGKSGNSRDGSDDETTCYAESTDGVQWTKPMLGLVEIDGSRQNNAVLGQESAPIPHNFTPFIDTRPGVPQAERYKALGGLFVTSNPRTTGGLLGLVSADGLHWRRIQEQAVISHAHHPQPTDTSASCAFWSEREGQYVCYLRTWQGEGEPIHPGWPGNIRWIGRTTSPDFLNWTKVTPVVFHQDGVPAPAEHLYTNQIHPYVRAPHIYIGFPRRFMPTRKVVPEHVNMGVSDGVFISSRDGVTWDRTFLEAFIRPGRDRQNWTDRNNTAAWGVHQTGPDELSIYWAEHFRHPTARVRRGTLRLDGFASVNAGYAGGELITRPLQFTGKALVINYATSAAGSLRVELQSETGAPLPGYRLEDCPEIYGDEIERVVAWQSGADVGHLAARPVRLRFVLKDADLYSIQFRE